MNHHKAYRGPSPKTPDPKLTVFLERELERRGQLRKGLFGPYQHEYARPWRVMLRLNSRKVLDALNPHTRADWVRALSRAVAKMAGADAPNWSPTRELFLVTLVDRRWSLDENEGEVDLSAFRDIRQAASTFLRDIDFIGMIDVSLYVSTRQIWMVPRRAFAHAHLICWGVSLEELKTRCRAFGKGRRAIIRRSPPGYPTPINPDDLLQVLWYVAKAPRNQYQLQLKPGGQPVQRQRAMAYVNHVRMLRLLNHLDLETFVIANGEGRVLSDRAMRLMAKWGHEASGR